MTVTHNYPSLRRPDLLETRSFIGGRWLRPTGRTIAVTNPATAEMLGVIGDFGTSETEEAIAAAERALNGWRRRSATERAAILNRFAGLVRANLDDLATILTVEQGKPLAEAKGEIAYAASHLEWFSEEAKRVYGTTIPAPHADSRISVIRQPVGVVAAITPWNFPSAMITRKLGPALATGCTVVLKPSELTPISALALARLGAEAGIPDGVFNVVTGMPAPIGAALTRSATVRKLTFTGSTAVGKLLLEQCAKTVKRVSMELGGNAPFLVFESANLEQAIEGVIASKFRNAGQTCVCANRILVHDAIYDKFASLLAERIGKMTVGNGLDERSDIGPLINDSAIEKVKSHVSDATEKGAHIVIGGQPHPAGPRFFSPTLIVDATDDMRIFHEETFGPVAPLFRFSDEAQAVAMANNTSAGLAAYIYTSDLTQHFRVTEALEYGMVGVNSGLISTCVAPFGGIKESGFGREGSHMGLDDYLNVKTVFVANVA